MKKLLFILLLAAFQIGLCYGQGKTVRGIVRDSLGPVLGATVNELSFPTNMVTTDSAGAFQLTLKSSSDSIMVSLVGYESQQIALQGRSSVNITLHQTPTALNEVIVIGFGKTNRITNTGSVATIKAEEIRRIPTSSVQNTLAGRMPGFFAQQRSGQPGKDASDYFIRGVSSLNSEGNKPLIIVDDIEYTYEQLAQINANEIESISILKDASTTAIYGIKGANGVLIVTTRRGALGRPQFNFRVETGLQTPVRKPDFLNAYQTAQLVNEAYENDGLNPQFTDEDLQHFKSGDDPYGHPDINWYDKIIRPSSLQHNANLDISGGSQAVKYFVSGGVFSQNGNIQDFSTGEDGVNTNYFYRRYDLRSNLDIQATQNFSLRLDVTARFGDINSPYNQNVTSNLYDFSKYHPYSAPYINPNGTYAYAYDTEDQLPTLNAMLATGGYSRQRSTDYNALIGFKEKMDFITKGLSLTGRLAYAGVEVNSLNLARPYAFPPSYHYDPLTDSYSLNTGTSSGGYTLTEYRTIGNTDKKDQRVNMQLYLNYVRNFGKHHFNSLLLYNQENYTNYQSAAAPQKFRGFSYKIGYDYDQKYLIDFNVGYNGSDRFDSDKRYGLFPAIGVGWNLKQEKLFEHMLKNFSLFKLRASYGVVGSDVAPGDQYLYQQVYVQGSGYSFGQSPQSQSTVYEGSLGNPNVTWEKKRSFDVGLDINTLNNKLSITADYFHDYRYDQLVTRNDIPLILGIGVSPTNVARTVNRGFDGQATYHDKAGQVDYSIGIVWSYAKNKILYEAEASPTYPWLAVTGHSIDQPFGYKTLGFYTQADIDNPDVAKPTTAIPVQAGDLRYKDLNEDGVIDENDRTAIGRPNLPNTTFGLPIKIGYKGLDISILFQGAFNYSLYLTGTAIEPFQSQFQPIHLKRWTPETAASAEFPRLTSNPTTVNSPAVYASDFWLINAYYVRLKTVELGYQFPKKLLPFKINNARLYLSAYNLATKSNISKKYQQDPEVQSNSAGDAYQNQRVVNLGLQIGF
ncbi:TonB-linked outer membrane protein, SusC/RagA family [Arachidicoccus rhizosphaerae]|uniref:TonB-linked outer membrane protein, SusC/RagA family n=1 Tax=Arachidicoccus rhizosphaerae TaxID=551991 RepID=A0A1H4BD08_9BACT|nr:TonB-dependent receptor [Arachidicoccus rhizosphaerae]SEA45997.1 TonB-linked outer membrane protein, SusC/RagA family [Arachidicoccus rhizosphaerae]